MPRYQAQWIPAPHLCRRLAVSVLQSPQQPELPSCQLQQALALQSAQVHRVKVLVWVLLSEQMVQAPLP